MPKLKTLITADIDLDMLRALDDRLETEICGYALDRQVLNATDLHSRCKDAEILICEYNTVDRALIEGSPRLKFIACCRGGVGSAVNLEAATERGIAVSHTPGRNANSVCDFIIGLIVDLSRNITKTNNLIKSRAITSEEGSAPSGYRDTVWGMDKDSPFVKYKGIGLGGKMVGIIGFGRIGRLLAAKVRHFGMRVQVYDPYYEVNEEKDKGLQLSSLHELLATSDFVSLSCSVTEETREMISRDELELMKSTAYLINTARGALVNEQDLIWALDTGQLAGAALDVTLVEPIQPDNPLIDLDNIILTPHLAGSSDEVRTATSAMIFRSIQDYLNGKVPAYCANPEVFSVSGESA